MSIYKTTLYPATGGKWELEDGQMVYEKMKAWVDGWVEIVPLPDGRYLIGNEESKIMNSPVKNELATAEWKKAYPITEYSLNNDELICGNAIVTSLNDAKLMDKED